MTTDTEPTNNVEIAHPAALQADLNAANDRLRLYEARMSRMRRDWDLLAERLSREADERDWCSEYDRIVEELNADLQEFQLLIRERDWTVQTNVTLTFSVNIGVKAVDKDAARDKVNDMDLDDVFREVRNSVSFGDYYDGEWTVTDIEEY